MAQLWHCCDCGVGRLATAPIGPLVCEPPCAAGAALKKKKKERKRSAVGVGGECGSREWFVSGNKSDAAVLKGVTQ